MCGHVRFDFWNNDKFAFAIFLRCSFDVCRGGVACVLKRASERAKAWNESMP